MFSVRLTILTIAFSISMPYGKNGYDVVGFSMANVELSAGQKSAIKAATDMAARLCSGIVGMVIDDTGSMGSEDVLVDENGKIFLRADRNGSESGRVYTITFKATDASNNVGYGSVEVLVPHDKGKDK